MKAILKSSARLLTLLVMLHTPMALAKGPPLGSPAYERTEVADLAVAGSSAYHSPVFVSAVPEPDTYAMMLAGVGLVGFMVIRRRRS